MLKKNYKMLMTIMICALLVLSITMIKVGGIKNLSIVDYPYMSVCKQIIFGL